MDKSDVGVCIIESNCFLREGLRSYLDKTRYKVHGNFSSIQDLVSERATIEGNSKCGCGLVVIGIGQDSDPKSVEGMLKTLKLQLINARIVILSSTLNEDLVVDFSNYADGYILNDISAEALVVSFDLIMLGEKIFPTSIIDLILKTTSHAWDKAKNDKVDVNYNLSKREMDILKCLVNGDSNKVIANHLSIADSTVKVHLKSILRKLGVSNRTQAALWAVNNESVESVCKDVNYQEKQQTA